MFECLMVFRHTELTMYNASSHILLRNTPTAHDDDIIYLPYST